MSKIKLMIEVEDENELDWVVNRGCIMADRLRNAKRIEESEDAISRQAVLEMAYDMSEIDGEHFTDQYMVVDVKDIQKLPPVTQKSETVTEFADRCRECGAKYGKLLNHQHCNDAISRQAVLDGIGELKKSPWATDKRGNGFEYLITEALDVVAELCVKREPSVNPQEPKTGRWIDDKCSECGKGIDDLIDSPEWYDYEEPNFCPFCGIKLEEAEV